MTRSLATTYFEGEGRPSMEACVRLAADWCVAHGMVTLVIFTGTGEGPHYAAKELLVDKKYKHLRAVAVTPPVGRPYRQTPGDPNSPLVISGLNPAMREELVALGVGIVSAHLPFKELYDGKDRTSEWSRVAHSFGILGGGFALCVQAALVACDAGLVDHGERVVALTADTAVVLRASRTECFLSPLEGLLAEHIICRPERYNISKQFHETIGPPRSEVDFLEAPEPAEARPDRAKQGTILTTGDSVPAMTRGRKAVRKVEKAKRRKRRSE